MTRAGVVAAALVAAVVVSAAPAGAGAGGSDAVAAGPARPTEGLVVGTGTPASCTSRAVVRAVARGGSITFDCGPAPVTIAMKRTAKVVNTSSRVVLDGGGLVTLSGQDRRRIL